MPGSEGPAVWISRGAYQSLAEEMPEASLVWEHKLLPVNRERELGLDRRETG
jgi:hypothetical protein